MIHKVFQVWDVAGFRLLVFVQMSPWDNPRWDNLLRNNLMWEDLVSSKMLYGNCLRIAGGRARI